MRAPLGILMLDTAFERFPGDVGHPGTWPFPVRFEIVKGATAARATGSDVATLLDPFLAAGRKLAAEGCVGLTTSCGFLAIHQKALASALPVPIATSALLQVAQIAMALGSAKTVGVLTFDGAALGPAHLCGASAPQDTPIEGLAPDCAMRRDILGGPPASLAEREGDVVAAARRLAARVANLGAIVCECTNFGPHRAAIQRATDLPVFDIVTLVTGFRARLSP